VPRPRRRCPTGTGAARIHAEAILVEPHAGQLARIAELVAAGHLRPVVGSVRSLRFDSVASLLASVQRLTGSR
jgi:phosphoribosylcarboxyaminoimidazole (NCAIR) mutase